MKLTKTLAMLAMGSALMVSGLTFAQEAKPADPAAPPADAKPAADAKPVKLVKPWGDLTTLTPEQRAKIDAIHKKALAEINVIEKREKEEILALLSEANHAELKDQAEAKKKADAAKRTAAKKPAAK